MTKNNLKTKISKDGRVTYMKFTKAELKVIHSTLVHHLAMLEAQIARTGWPETEETKLTKSILNKIAKHQPLPTAHHD